MGVVDKGGVLIKLQGIKEYCGYTTQVCSGWIPALYGDLDVHRQLSGRKCLFHGTPKSHQLFELVLQLRKLEMQLSVEYFWCMWLECA